MKKQVFPTVVLLVIILFSCKDKTNDLSQNKFQDDSFVILNNRKTDSDIASTATKTPIEQNHMVDLPFDFEQKNKLANTDEAKFAQRYPTVKGEKLETIKKYIYSNNEDNPDEVFQINNGGKDFDTYVYCTYGDSDSQTLINVKNEKIISWESIGYATPEDETYQSFIINKDLHIIIYNITYTTKSKRVLEKYLINLDGSISKMK
ncbi:hypothetical protein [Flavobacterium aestivum]|uniref:hypothetical protein n=1 Tax=Flavobacterium aestivum TaxID=3003257 RepID=UPI0022865FCA|nr:hypothetical protein [Flavobacterium aestivum]